MQFFPSSSVNSPLGHAAEFFSAAVNAPASGFEETLSSFIEEGRGDYTGLPPGFAALKEEGGSVDLDQAQHLKKELKKRNISEESLAGLEALMSSGQPMSVGRIFGVLSGASRASSPLTEEEQEVLSGFFGRVGFNKDETDELLSFAAAGKGASVMKALEGKLGKDSLELHQDEFSALVRSLDVSGDAAAKMHKLFGQGGSLSLSRAEFDTLFAEASRDLAAKAKAAQVLQANMRAAVGDALQNAKLDKLAGPAADNRGTKRSEAAEEKMKAGIDAKTAKNVHGDNRLPVSPADEKEAKKDFSDPETGKNRAERILETGKNVPSKDKAEAPKNDVFSSLLQHIDVPSAPFENGSAQLLNNIGNRTFRQEIFTQVEQGLLQNTQNGLHKMTLQLNPENLGQLTLIMSVQQGEVRAVIRADQAESAALIQGRLEELKQSLEAQGLKVAELDVQTNLQGNSQDGSLNHAGEHNLMQDAQERDRMQRLGRLRREAGTEGSAPEGAVHNNRQTADNGLHIVA